MDLVPSEAIIWPAKWTHSLISKVFPQANVKVMCHIRFNRSPHLIFTDWIMRQPANKQWQVENDSREEITFVCVLSETSNSKHCHYKLTSLWPLSVHSLKQIIHSRNTSLRTKLVQTLSFAPNTQSWERSHVRQIVTGSSVPVVYWDWNRCCRREVLVLHFDPASILSWTSCFHNSLVKCMPNIPISQ